MIETLTEKILEETNLIDIIDLMNLKTEYLKLHQSNKEIFDSFRCAAAIQQGMLPQQRHFERLFTEYFVLYHPQHIISGDFYWIGVKEETVFFSVSDCTGHGIGGAMLSVLGISFLNYIVYGKKHDSLGSILEELDKKWIETFNMYADKDKDNNWMELSLCSFNTRTRVLKFSGARSKVIIINDEGEYVLEGERYPIGGWQLEANRNFNETEMVLPPNSMIYLSSDGYKDQLGGPKGKTMKEKRMREYISELYYLPVNVQKAFLNMALNEWKGDNTQTDDVCVLGIRL